MTTPKIACLMPFYRELILLACEESHPEIWNMINEGLLKIYLT